MTVLFCVRPTTRNIGNDTIYRATAGLLADVFDRDTSIVSIPALQSNGLGGFSAAQVYDMNRLADGVVLGGGNLFENGQLAVDPVALDALDIPLLLIGLSHGRIHDRHGQLSQRTDSLAPALIRQLMEKASVALVRDHASQAALEILGAPGAEVGGCPSLSYAENLAAAETDGRVLVSIRHPARMSVIPQQQWAVVSGLRDLLGALKRRFGAAVHLVCHDYHDIELARGLPDTPLLHFDLCERYHAALRRARLSIAYRLHAFLPCLAFGVPSIHLSYDERGRAMVATAGMADWDIDLLNQPDFVGAVMERVDDLPRYFRLRAASAAARDALMTTTRAGVRRFAGKVEASMPAGRWPSCA